MHFYSKKVLQWVVRFTLSKPSKGTTPTKNKPHHTKQNIMKDLTTYEAAHILLDDEYANWSYNAAFALVEYIEEIEEETGGEYELDRVALRCEFSEYGTLEEWAEEHGADLGEAPEDDDERDEEIREYIQDRGVLIEFDGGVIVSEF